MEALIIHKGEQYAVPFEILLGDAPALPEDLDGLRIQIGGRLLEYPGELSWDAERAAWLYPLTEDQSLTLRAGLQFAEVAVKIGGDIVKSDTVPIQVKDSIIKEGWSDGG